MNIADDVKFIFAKVEAGAADLFHKAEGVIESFEATKSGAFVAQVLENTAIGTKVENLLQDVKLAGKPLLELIEHIANEIVDDVAKVEGLVGDAKAAAVAVASTAVNDVKAIV